MDMIGDLFGGFDGNPSSPVASPRRDRKNPPGAVFFATRPDDEAARKGLSTADRLRNAHGLRGKLQTDGMLHLTQSCIGHYPDIEPAKIDLARKIAAAFRFEPFDITLDCALSFDTRKPTNPLVLSGKQGLLKCKMFGRALLNDLKRGGIRPVAVTDQPHMTVLYDTEMVKEQAIEPISWTVQEFFLIHSHYRLSKHEVIGHWRLRG